MIMRGGRYWPGESLRESFAKEFPVRPKPDLRLGQIAGDPPGVIVKIDWFERAFWTVPNMGCCVWNDSANWTRHEMG